MVVKVVAGITTLKMVFATLDAMELPQAASCAVALVGLCHVAPDNQRVEQVSALRVEVDFKRFSLESLKTSRAGFAPA